MQLTGDRGQSFGNGPVRRRGPRQLIRVGQERPGNADATFGLSDYPRALRRQRPPGASLAPLLTSLALLSRDLLGIFETRIGASGQEGSRHTCGKVRYYRLEPESSRIA